MKVKNVVVATLIALGLIFVVSGIIFHYMPAPRRCNPGGCLSSPNSPGCSYQPEIAPDSTLPVPVDQPYLGGFGSSTGGGPPFCSGVWYAYRYVSPVGGYSPLSPWSGTNPTSPSLPPLPIYAGSSNLPCPPTTSGCQDWGITPQGTCSANVPMIVLTSPIPSLPPGTVLNIHRQSGPTFDPSSEGQIIGKFYASGLTNKPSMVSTYFYDVGNNPDPRSVATSCCS